MKLTFDPFAPASFEMQPCRKPSPVQYHVHVNYSVHRGPDGARVVYESHTETRKLMR